MKTNKILLSVLAAAGMLFTACSNDEPVQLPQDAQAISFRMPGGTPAGIQRTPGTTIEYVDAFVVYGTDNVFGDALIFDGTTVARDINQIGNIFTYAPTRYYDLAATSAAFVAFSPASAKISNVVKTPFLTTGLSFNYTVPAPDDSGNAVQEDLLVADTTLLAITPTVNLTFKHALARVFVTATNTTKDPVFIDSLILRNLKTIGTLEFDVPADTWEWTSQNTSADYAYVLAPSGVAVDSMTTNKTLVTSMEQGMLVLPQKTANMWNNDVFDTGDFALQINYKFANLGEQKKYILLEENFEFEAGKQYLINIDFTGMGIDFTITVKDFDAPIEVDYP